MAKNIPSLQTNDPQVIDIAQRGNALVSKIAGGGKKNLNSPVLSEENKRILKYAKTSNDENAVAKLQKMLERKGSVEPENARRRQLFRRFDNLFHARKIRRLAWLGERTSRSTFTLPMFQSQRHCRQCDQ
jgi:hypothetical protein